MDEKAKDNIDTSFISTQETNNYTDIYNFFEFVEQYDDVWNDTKQKFLGIGVAIRKSVSPNIL